MNEKEQPKNKKNQPRETKSKSNKKGCLSGCLITGIAVFLLLFGLSIYAYFNFYKIFPAVAERMGGDINTVMQLAGTEIETGVPSEFLDNAYRIDISRENGEIKVTSTDMPIEEAFGIYVEYLNEDGWVIEEELEALETAPQQVKSFSRHMEELKVAKLVKNGDQMGLAVTEFMGDTVSILWHHSDSDTKTADHELDKSKKEKDFRPEEVSGTDPENVPLYPDAVRTSYRSFTEGDRTIYDISYLIETERNKVLEFYKKEIKNSDWNTVRSLETEQENILEAAKEEETLYINIKESDAAPDYTELKIILK